MQKHSYIFLSIFVSLFLCINDLSAQEKIDRAIEAYNAGNYSDAITLLETEVNTGNTSLIVFQYLGNSYIELKEHSKAITILEKAIKLNPGNSQFLFTLGKLYALQNRYPDAVKYLQMIEGFKEKKDVKELLSMVYYNDGVEQYKNKNNEKALALFRKSIELNSLNQNSYLNLASILYQQKKFEAAKQVLEKAIKLFPNDINMRKSYASVLGGNKNYKEAIRILEALAKEFPKDFNTRLQLAALYNAAYQIGKTDTTYINLIKDFPSNKEVYKNALEFWGTFNNQSKIRDAYLLMQKNFPDEKGLTLKIGKTFENENKPDEAKQYYKDVLSKDSLNKEIQFAMADLCKKNKDNSTAITELKKILKCSPDDVNAYKKLNDIYLENDQIRDAIALNNSSGEKYYSKYQLTLIYNKLNQKDSANIFLEEAYRLNPFDPFILKEKAKIEIEKKDKQKTIEFALLAFKRSIDVIDEKQNLMNQVIAEQSSHPFEITNDESGSLKKEIKLFSEAIAEINTILRSQMSGNEYESLLNDYLQKYPKSTFLILFKAEALSNDKNYLESEEYFKKALFLNPSVKEIHIKYAELQHKEGKINQAILSYRKALEIDSNDDSIYSSLIKMAEEQNQLANLCDDWKILYSRNTENKILRERLIEVLHKTNRLEEAQEIINQK